MPRKLPPDPNEKPQIERFVEAARKFEASKTDEVLADIVRTVAPLPDGKREKQNKKR